MLDSGTWAAELDGLLAEETPAFHGYSTVAVVLVGHLMMVVRSAAALSWCWGTE